MQASKKVNNKRHHANTYYCKPSLGSERICPYGPNHTNKHQGYDQGNEQRIIPLLYLTTRDLVEANTCEPVFIFLCNSDISQSYGVITGSRDNRFFFD